MWKLHRYYLKELLVNAAIAFVVLFAVVLVSLVYKGIQKSQGGSPFDAVLITLFFALDSFQHLLTISFLIATVLTFTRAAQDRELIAVRAAGVSPTVPLMSAVLIGLLLTAIGSLAVHYLIPEAHYRKYRLVAEVVRNAVLSLGLDSDRIRHPQLGFVMTFRERVGDEYRGCTLYLPKPLPRFEGSILFVERVRVPDFKDSATLQIVLEGVANPLESTFDPGRITIDVPIEQLGVREARVDRDDDLRSDQLLTEVARGVHPKPDEAIYTLFRRCCFSLMPALLAPIGFCVAEFARERGRIVALVLSLVPLALFYLGELFGARLLLTTGSPAAAWLPIGMLLLFGLPLCWRQLRR